LWGVASGRRYCHVAVRLAAGITAAPGTRGLLAAVASLSPFMLLRAPGSSGNRGTAGVKAMLAPRTE
jgi:hypothetical protein